MSSSKQLSKVPIARSHLPKHIKQGHQLVFSRKDLSQREADLFALMMAQMKSEDWDKTTPQYTFTASQLSEWLKIDSKHIGSILSPAAERLSTHKIGIKIDSGNGDYDFDYKPLLKRIQYKKGVLTMVPNDMLESEYIEFRQGFALVTTKTYLDIKQEYAKRLYEILSRFKKDGYEMHFLKIDELKGLFGLLDVKGKLKENKSSFSNNGVFMQRCIRDSIEKLMAHPIAKKEFLFLKSPNGEIGYELRTQGKRISEIKFLVRWLDKGTVDELNMHDALKTVKELISKQITTKEKLSRQELIKLMLAYRYLGQDDEADRVELAIQSKSDEEELQQEKDEDVNDELASIIELSKGLEY
ncbi:MULTISPECIES: replication initiation protein [Pseudoalteromonas]|uniref:replication initiation protein n=1 Tax=Pseudoalteromonas TaxID=53246 RepID=UPI0015815D65|nr:MULTISPECIES: replication initiation protein [Pseudoalteromonas]MDI4654250.1 replication initiation protein [Pseudoalteromonas shioyasakiensis]NUJ40204.1 replication initiation protein [Pseudoalteromonas sp. 0303]